MKKYLLPFFFFSVIACNLPSSKTDEFHSLITDPAWVAANPAMVANGVYYYDSCETDNGVTLLDEQMRSTLIDMKGNVLAKFPFGITHISSDGTMIGAMIPAVVKYDADLNLIWKIFASPHHDITTDENGVIYLLSSDVHKFMGLNVNFDVLKIYCQEGDLIYEWRVFDHLEEFVSVISKSAYLNNLHHPYDTGKGVEEYISQDPERFFWHFNPVSKDTAFEFTHFNSIQVLPENAVSKKIPAFKKGNLLLSFNPYSCYGILDTALGKIEWAAYLPERATLHTPLLTPDGTILVFQNSTESSFWVDKENDPCLEHLHRKIPPKNPSPDPEPRNWVSITEYNPLTNAKVWEYTANPRESLRALMLGSAQRLSNGNTLVCAATDDKGGQIFELTPDKKIVWSYVSPEKNTANEIPLSFYRAKRINFDIAKKIIPGLKQ